ncbi:MAG TPA: SpoIIE family protein phosphatase [Solirubrobacterales bacterium]
MSWIALVVLGVAVAALCAALGFLLRGRKLRRRFRVLADVAAVSEAAGSLEETFDAICEIVVPELADFCMIDMIEDGEARRAAVGVAPDAPAGVVKGLRERLPSTPVQMLGTGEDRLEPRFIERFSEDSLRGLAHDEGADLEFLRGLRMRSAITVALNARGKVMGTLTLVVAWSGRRYRADDAEFAWVLSGRVALTLDNCGLFANLERAERTRAQIAETLQHGLLPPPLPHVPGWSMAAMYRPAGAQNEVGGDFYDVFRLARGWMLVIGDVVGRGASAAAITAMARYTLRTAAMLTDDPLVALAALNRTLLARPDASLCSIAAVALQDNAAAPVRIAVAGHPPPLLVDGDSVSEASAPGDPVLGAFADAEWEIEEQPVDRGQHLVLVTDGVTEAGGASGRFGEQRLREHLVGTASPSHAVQRIEGALNSFTGGRLDDDAAILALTRSAADPALTAVASVGGG